MFQANCLLKNDEMEMRGTISANRGLLAKLQLPGERLVTIGVRVMEIIQQTPTLAESGLPGYEVTAWNAFFAPAGTPQPIVTRLNGLVKTGLTNPETKSVMEAQGLDATPSTPGELGQLVKTELVKWAKLIKVAGIKPE